MNLRRRALIGQDSGEPRTRSGRAARLVLLQMRQGKFPDVDAEIDAFPVTGQGQ